MDLGGQSGMPGTGDSPDASGDINLDSLLGTSPEGDTTGGLQGGTQQQGVDAQAQAAAPFKFAGRTWNGGQKEAEAAWNKLYGGYSDRQGLVNALKNGNPELLAAIAQDPKMAQILGKLGIEAAKQAYGGQRQMGAQEQMSPEQMVQEFRIERRQNEILREEFAFEKQLGRPLTPKEMDAVYAVLQRAGNEVSYEEAYFLAHRQQLLRQQAQVNAAQQGAQAQQASGRPKPPPRSIPGTPAPGRKSVKDMSKEEWRANLKQSGLVQQMMSKGMSS